MSLDHITASIDPSAIYGGVYDPKFKPYAIYAERLLADLLQSDAKKMPRYQTNEDRDTRAAVLAAMATFKGQEATLAEIAAKKQSMNDITLRKWLNRLAGEGVLEKQKMWIERATLTTYKLPVVK